MGHYYGYGKSKCAELVYTALVHEIVAAKEQDFAMLDNVRQGQVVEVLLSRNSLFPISEDFLDALGGLGITVTMLQEFGFVGSVVDSLAINVPAVKAAKNKSPGLDPSP